LVAGRSPRRRGRERSERESKVLQVGIKTSSPSKESMGKITGLTSQIPCRLLYHGFGDAYPHELELDKSIREKLSRREKREICG
jgi:hypothetical protein